jgi:hypothetical protein
MRIFALPGRLIRLKRFSEALRVAQHAKLVDKALTKRLQNLDLKIVSMPGKP